jgi:hypothetical protein
MGGDKSSAPRAFAQLARSACLDIDWLMIAYR